MDPRYVGAPKNLPTTGGSEADETAPCNGYESVNVHAVDTPQGAVHPWE